MHRRDDSALQKGMTLIEVLVSLVILAFAALGITTMVTMALHMDALAKERSIATSLASERAQRLASLPMQAAANYARYRLPEETATASPTRKLTAGYGTIPGYSNFKRVVELNYDVPTAGMLSVKTTVSWKHINQMERNHTMIVFLHPGLE